MRISPLLILSFVAVAACETASQTPVAYGLKTPVVKASSQSIRVTDMLEETLPSPDIAALLRADAMRAGADTPPRFAVTHSVSHAPTFNETGARGDLHWSMRIRAPGAKSLSFGFSQYRLPHGATLTVYNDVERIRSFDDSDNKVHGQLWTPILRGDEAVIELSAPAGSSPALLLSTVNVGFRDLMTLRSADCNVDVACPAGDAWRSEIRSVAVIGTGSGTFCSGFMVNSEDGRDFFMTAHHCQITEEVAPSLVAYWNYETSACGGSPDGKLNQFTTGATWRAGGAASDFELVEFNSKPAAEYNVHWAGWDATGTAPLNLTGIHHPNVDEKRISHSNVAGLLAGWGTDDTPSDGTHWRVQQWDIGTTEPGSSGSGVWNQDHRIVGQLHGGGAACGNTESDYYGNFSVSFDAGLQPFLSKSGARTSDGRDQCNAPKITASVSPNPAKAGDEIAFTSAVSGGEAPYTFAWDTDGNDLIDCITANCTRTFTGNMSADVRLTVKDATGCVSQVSQHLSVADPGCPAAKLDASGLPLAIADKSTLASKITAIDQGHLSTARVWVRIKHSYREDLRISLSTPSGKEVVLADRVGGSAHDFTLDGAALSTLAGEATAGEWTLTVSDSEDGDTGSLEAFALELVGRCD